MNIINEIIRFSKPFIKENEMDSFTVSYKKHWEVENKPYPYNKLIREKVKNDYGVYLWTKNDDEIIYIGIAGKLKLNGDDKIIKGGHYLSKRLIATRGRDKENKKDIPTRKFLRDYMKENNVKEMKFYVLYTKDEVPPTYLEAKLLNEYYSKKNKLPKLNRSF